MIETTWRFELTDSGFFKEARHHGAISGLLTSLFPLPLNTFAGAIRTAIGNHHGADWQDYKNTSPQQTETRALVERIGRPSDYGPLRFQGPWLCRDEQRLYPVPASLSVSKRDKRELRRTFPGEAIYSDMGRVFVPDETFAQTVPATGYLTQQGILDVLQGGLPELCDWLRIEDIVKTESRLGIALNHDQRSVIEQQLYQAQHLRFHPSVFFEVDVGGLSVDEQPRSGILSLGGEGRMASYTVSVGMRDRIGDPPLCSPPASTNRFMLILLSPVETGSAAAAFGLPPGFRRIDPAGSITRWEGQLQGLPLRIWSALMTKPLRMGGWDLAMHRPRPVCSLIPPGTVYFCESDHSFEEVHTQLHGKTLLNGDDRRILNRGLLAVALWPSEEQPHFEVTHHA